MHRRLVPHCLRLSDGYCLVGAVGMGFVGGDFNTVVEGEGRFKIRVGTNVNSFEPEQRLFFDIFGSRLRGPS